MAYKDIRGNWRDETSIPLEGKRRLKISTHKTHVGNMVTTATVAVADGMWETHAMYEDYSARWAISTPKRVTQKVVEEQHQSVMLQIEAIQAAVAAFYKEKGNDQAHS